MSNTAIPDSQLLRPYVFGAYDLQTLRIQIGLRLVANFRSKLKKTAPDEAPEPDDDSNKPDDELTEEGEKLIDYLKASYNRLTDGVARNRTLPSEKGFVGDELITSYTELVLVDQYIQIEKNEKTQFRQFERMLDRFPIYTQYLSKQIGIGPGMAAVLISYLDPAKARHVSSFWRYTGIDVAEDGFGRSRRAEHLIDRSYKDRNGEAKTRKSVTYNPWLKSRLVFVMGANLLKSGSPWRRTYDQYKHRLATDPARQKATVAEYKKAYASDPEAARHLWTPGRIHRAATRYMIKMFLQELWVKWRTLEGLPVTPSYHEAKQGHVHGAVTGRVIHSDPPAA